MDVEFWVACGQIHPREMVTLAPVIEELGFDAVALGDHVLLPTDVTSYPYSADGRPPFADDSPWTDVWVAAAALSMVTETLHFVSSVYVLPLRHPLVVSRAVAAASAFSGGRVRLGVGLGWAEEEYRALGVEFGDRGSLADEAIEVLRRSWEPGPFSWSGRHYTVPPTHLEPRPPAPVPVLIGGTAPRALRRAARLGDGYLAPPGTMAATTDLIGRLRVATAELPTPRAPLPVYGRLLDAHGPEDYLAMAAHGVAGSTLVLPAEASPAERTVLLEEFAAEVLQPVRALSPP